jgi:hypothetical protein
VILLASELDYIQESTYKTIAAELGEVRRMLTAFYKRVRRIPEKPSGGALSLAKG